MEGEKEVADTGASGQFDDPAAGESKKTVDVEQNDDDVNDDADEQDQDNGEDDDDKGQNDNDGEEQEEEDDLEAPSEEEGDENVKNSSQPSSPEEKKHEDEAMMTEQHHAPSSMDVKSKKKRRKKGSKSGQHHRTPKMFLDSISVVIPLDVTADLKIAIQRTRSKRIKSIYKHFPTLNKSEKRMLEDSNNNNNDDPMLDEDDADENNKDKDGKPQQPPPKKKKKLENVPRPEQYGSVLDYLEAKYVKGVQLGDDEDDGKSMDDKSEGHGSVYSGGSFLDDTDLQRDVAEQVMANTTLTKLELEEDDADFFVNVGNLEVEDDQYGDNYDPLQDKENQTKKRKKKSESTAASKAGSAQKEAKKKDSLNDTGKTKKSEASAATTTTKKKKKSLDSSVKSTKSTKSKTSAADPELKEKKAKARKAKSKTDKLYKKLVVMVKGMGNDTLPRRQTKKKVALTCPQNKKAGDDITFTNPHNPGQRLRVKIPKDCFPGGTFKVSVPVKADAGDDEKDNNKFSREFQELLDDYARAFDDWCSAQSEVDKKFPVFRQRVNKFDTLVKEFPKNLVTPIDAEYLKKVMRRARQNKHKRMKTVELKKQAPVAEPESSESEEEEEVPPPETRTVLVPTMGSEFPSIKFNPKMFGLASDADAPLSAAFEKPTSAPKRSPGRFVEVPTVGKEFPKKKLNETDFAS